MNAEVIIRKEYGGSRNFITNRVLSFYRLPDGAAELSEGEGIIDRSKKLYGVSIVRLNKDGSTTRETDISRCFPDLDEALAFLVSLGAQLDNPSWLRTAVQL